MTPLFFAPGRPTAHFFRLSLFPLEVGREEIEELCSQLNTIQADAALIF